MKYPYPPHVEKVIQPEIWFPSSLRWVTVPTPSEPDFAVLADILTGAESPIGDFGLPTRADTTGAY